MLSASFVVPRRRLLHSAFHRPPFPVSTLRAPGYITPAPSSRSLPPRHLSTMAPSHQFTSKPSDAIRRRLSSVASGRRPNIAGYTSLTVRPRPLCPSYTLIESFVHTAHVGWYRWSRRQQQHQLRNRHLHPRLGLQHRFRIHPHRVRSDRPRGPDCQHRETRHRDAPQVLVRASLQVHGCRCHRQSAARGALFRFLSFARSARLTDDPRLPTSARVSGST